jgi:deoxyadenosine kinase
MGGLSASCDLRGGKGGVQDRTIYEDSVFARMLRDSGYMDERDYNTYIELFKNMSNFMKKPNIIVHLDVKPQEALDRIRTRSRGCETGISVEYLTALYNAYETFIAEISRVIPVIKIDYSEFRSVDEMATRIVAEYERIANIRSIGWKSDSSPKTTPHKVAGTVNTEGSIDTADRLLPSDV